MNGKYQNTDPEQNINGPQKMYLFAFWKLSIFDLKLTIKITKSIGRSLNMSENQKALKFS